MRSLLFPVACCLLAVGCGAPGATISPSNSAAASQTTSVSLRLPPPVIQKIVRQKFPKYRRCYEDGLRRDLTLKGRVSVRFVIERDGSISHIQNGGSQMPDAEVIRCVIEAFGHLGFPQPENGTVTVVYPILFSLGNGRHRADDCLFETKTEETMIMETRTCPTLVLMNTLMKTEEGVTEAFASRHLSGFEQNAAGTRAHPTIAGRETWTSTIAAGAGKPFRKMSIMQYKPGWAEFFSCQDEWARNNSPRCDQEIERLVQRAPQAKK